MKNQRKLKPLEVTQEGDVYADGFAVNVLGFQAKQVGFTIYRPITPKPLPRKRAKGNKFKLAWGVFAIDASELFPRAFSTRFAARSWSNTYCDGRAKIVRVTITLKECK